MKIVCDTNVIVSALLFPGGRPDNIIQLILSGRCSNAVSPDMLTELRSVFERKFSLTKSEVDRFVGFIAEMSTLVYPTERIMLIERDNTDNRILECGITADAKYIITGDKKHLLPLKSYRGIAIVSPRRFFELES